MYRRIEGSAQTGLSEIEQHLCLPNHYSYIRKTHSLPSTMKRWDAIWFVIRRCAFIYAYQSKRRKKERKKERKKANKQTKKEETERKREKGRRRSETKNFKYLLIPHTFLERGRKSPRKFTKKKFFILYINTPLNIYITTN